MLKITSRLTRLPSLAYGHKNGIGPIVKLFHQRQLDSTMSSAGSIGTPSSYQDLVDVDANLLHKDFQDCFEEVVRTAEAVGVGQFVVPGSTLSDSAKAIALAKSCPEKYIATAGVHPYHVSTNPPTANDVEKLRSLIEDGHCAAVGECGLDQADGFPPLDTQMPWFTMQLDVACSINKPIFLHERLSFDVIKSALEARRGKLPKVLVHCFTGTPAELKWYTDFGCYIGFTGHVLQPKKSAELRQYLLDHGTAAVSLDRVMIETDAPYMGFKRCRAAEATQRKKTSPNVPSALPLVLEGVAELLGVEPNALARASTATARAFFQPTAEQ
eukprot:m.252518 g.252518  ORF g.252518 m.252518 type:complete len:328 (+) comp19567_c0_seq5:281-1264(+)